MGEQARGGEALWGFRRWQPQWHNHQAPLAALPAELFNAADFSAPARLQWPPFATGSAPLACPCAKAGLLLIVFETSPTQVGNAIGKLNRHTFLAFLWLELYALLSSLGAAVIAVRAYITAGFWSDRLGCVRVIIRTCALHACNEHRERS